MSGNIGTVDTEQNSKYPQSQSHSSLLETSTQEVSGVLEMTAGVLDAKPRSRPLYHTDFDSKPLVNDVESRFHHKRRIVIGNVSKFIPKDKRAPGLLNASHKWMIYVRAPPWSPPLTTFISKIRLYIHHSYAPDHIIDITSPPFRLIRHGWGEFPIRVQIHLIDRSKNKPVNFIHLLQLDQTHSGRQVLGAEEEFDIELDKNTDLSLVAEKSESKDDYSDRSHILSRKLVSVVEQFSRILHEIIDQFPLISVDVDISAQSLPYPIHSSIHAFLSLSQEEQETIEDKRAQFIIAHLRNQNIDLPAEASVEYVKNWCRENGHTPQDVISKPLRMTAGFEFPASVPANTLLCKSCGRQACVKRSQKHECPFFVLSCFSNHVSSSDNLTLNVESDSVADLQIDDLTSYSSGTNFSSSKTPAFRPDNSLPYTLLSFPSFAFITQTISQLNLPCFLPSSTPSADTQSNFHKEPDFVLTRRNRLSYSSPPSGHLWSGQNGHEEEVLCVITLAMGRFLKQIVEKSIKICRNEQTSERASGNHSVLTPMHVWKAIAGRNGLSTLKKDEKAVSLHDGDEMETSVGSDTFDFLRGLYCVDDRTGSTQSSIDTLSNKNLMD
ncbi:yeats family-domain-containing protein [Paraphysoderma sedebokerense]|nr:yeats family-domain-containing protein [Paraphysoderma sedebokerense]